MLDPYRDIGSDHKEGLSYYGFEPPQPASDRGPKDRQHKVVQEKDRERPSSFIKSAWTAINRYAANPFSSNASAKCQATLASLGPQKGTEPENEHESDKEEDMDGHESDVMHNHIKDRQALINKGVSHHNKMPSFRKPSTDSVLTPRSGNARKPSRNWTKQEEITLLSAREEGKSWNAIHEVGLPPPPRLKGCCT